jgi:DNA-directed RNA polymerase alpha subunit
MEEHYPLLRKIKNKEAIAAIKHGCQNGDTVYELEPLGVYQRITNILEDNEILYLADLLKLSYEELSLLRDIGPNCSTSIISGLAQYHLLDKKRESFVKGFFVNPEYLKGVYDFNTDY